MKKYFLLLTFLALAATPALAQRKAKAKARAPKLTQAEKERAAKLQQMVDATQKIVFFDSIVVPKEKLLAQYRLSSEAGRVTSYNDLFKTDDQPNAYAYVNELGSKSYYSLEDTTGRMSLFASDQLGGKWSKPRPLDGLDGEDGLTDFNYPYMMADGVTLYFAAKGEESIGGYDIFVTRYDASTDTYLKPENVGMPFNSPANDYLFAVDELNNIGWFATDRGQTAGKVCVYLFVPTTTRQTYAADGLSADQLQSLARLDCIADTWGDGTARDAAAARLEAASKATEAKQVKREFTFVINDKATYTRLSDFRSPDAKERMRQLVKMQSQLASLTATLQGARSRYASAGNAERKALRPEILASERQLEQLEAEAGKAAKEIRRIENTYINR